MPSCLALLAALAGPSMLAIEEPPRTYQVVSPKDDGIVATGLNEGGDIVGFDWVEDKQYPGVIGQEPFFARGKTKVVLPLLKGYTATFPAAVSDAGLVVGRVGKPAAPGQVVPMRNQAFAWDEAGGIRGLGTLPDDSASIACGVTRDGTRISGFSVGSNRTRACVWDRVGDRWEATALPHAGRLGSQVVAISGDGRFVAAVDEANPCLWTRSKDGQWEREVLGDPGSLIPRAVNNAGVVVGVCHTGDGLTHAVLWTRDKGLRRLEKLAGYLRSEANAVNDAGVVVGMIDGPHGSDVGPNAFAYEGGKLRLILEGGPNFVGASAINNKGQVAGTMEKAEEDEKPKADPPRP